MAAVFWDAERITVIDYLEHDSTRPISGLLRWPDWNVER